MHNYTLNFLIDWGVPYQKEISGFMRTNSKGYCNYRAGIQGVTITLCEENPDGTIVTVLELHS